MNIFVKDRSLHFARGFRHEVKLALDGFELFDFRNLGLLHFFVFKELFALFDDVFAHYHGLLKVRVAVLKNLLEGLLIQLNHSLLVFKHLA